MKDDLISKQALLAEYDRLHVGEPGKARKMIEDAPSAQQDVTDTNVGDMINRQAAISRAVTITMFGRDIRVVGVSELESLPSVQPERKTGHWEIYIISMLDGEGCRCSKCGFEGVPYWDFCPSCGADMRGEQNE